MKGVIVVGKGRSGTTSLTCLLAQGFGFNDSDLKRTEQRTWEVSELARFNEQILKDLGGSWDHPPDDVGDLSEYVEPARELFNRIFWKSEPWVWKDPRTSLLLPFWRHVLGDDGLMVIGIHRNPLDVAASLFARNRFETEFSLELYRIYWRSIYEGVMGLPFMMIEYDELVDNTWAVALQIENFLGVTCRNINAIDSSKRHHRGGNG